MATKNRVVSGSSVIKTLFGISLILLGIIHPVGAQIDDRIHASAPEAAEYGEIEWFVRKGFTVLAPDLIGVGEMGSGDVENYYRIINYL